MTFRLRLPFLTEDRNDMTRTILVRRLAQIEPGRLEVQGFPVGSKAKRPSVWRASGFDIANMLYARTVGYRGKLHLSVRSEDDIWAALALKIEKEKNKP